MKKIDGYIQLTRPINLLIAFVSIFMGGFVTGSIQPLARLLFACLSGTFIAAGANAVNDFYDLEIDRINRPKRPLPSGRISPTHAHVFSIVLFILGIVFSVFIHMAGTIIAISSSVLLYLYSLRLKRTVLWGNITVATITGMAFVYGGMAVGRTRVAMVVGVFAFFYHGAREIIKDVEDIEGDQAQGISTLPIRYGVKSALVWITIALIILIGLTFIPYVLGIFSVYYLVIVVVGVDFFLVYVLMSMWRNSEPRNLGRLSVWMKADMLMGLLAVYLG
jgi:geranylgeranylglycerol-phosphate geranylgeranyltransferase